MKVWVFIILVLFTACRYSAFDKYPGTRINQFDPKLQGRYKDSSGQVILNIGPNVFYSLHDSVSTPWNLSDSVVFSKYRNNYFISIRGEHEYDSTAYFWSVVPFEYTDDSLVIYFMEEPAFTQHEANKMDSIGSYDGFFSGNIYRMNERKYLKIFRKIKGQCKKEILRKVREN